MSIKNNVVVVACEGQHDISFITRILLTVGFIIDSRKIKDFPTPFGALFSGIAGKIILADRKLGYQNPNYLLPSVALKSGEDIIFLHNLNGDGRSAERQKLIDSYTNLVGDDDFSKDLNYRFKFLLFFDADTIGVQARLLEISTEIGINPTLTNGVVVPYGRHELGCYVYHEPSANTGVLEDILLEHFSRKDRELMNSVSSFLTNNALEEERTKEFHIVGGVEQRNGSSKYYEKKSKLSLFGQLQFSGMNNSVIISKSDFLTKHDIENCPQCNIIRSMFQ